MRPLCHGSLGFAGKPARAPNRRAPTPQIHKDYTVGRASLGGLASVAATSAVANLVLKPVGRRRRPDPIAGDVPEARRVQMPTSTSFPSGHSAAAFAFATGVGHVLPREAIALRGLAAVVAYSRVHTGVHYPGDALAGSLLGGAVAQLTSNALDRRFGQA